MTSTHPLALKDATHLGKGAQRLRDMSAARVDLRAAEAPPASCSSRSGPDIEHEGLRETPRRMATAYAELLTPEPVNLTTFPNEEGYDELVPVRDIPFQSQFCAACRRRGR